MAFNLESIFSTQPERTVTRPETSVSQASGKGADFARNLSQAADIESDETGPDPVSLSETGQTSVAAILVNNPPAADTTDTLVTTGAVNSTDGTIQVDPELEAVAGYRPEQAITAIPNAEAIKAKMLLSDAEPAAQEATEPADASSVESVEVVMKTSIEIGRAAPTQKSDEGINTAKAPAPADVSSDPSADGSAATARADPAVQATLVSAATPAAIATDAKLKGTASAGLVSATRPSFEAQTPDIPGKVARETNPLAKAPEGDTLQIDADQPSPALLSNSAEGLVDANPNGTDSKLSSMLMATQPNAAMTQTISAQASGAPLPGTMTPTLGIMASTPAQVVDIVSDSLANPDDRKDRIVVQLDPPELGRVSIDFKFDANGIQHVTITGETPEALRQLRLMHFELVNAMEKQGLSGQSMSFQQHQTPQDQSQLAVSNGRVDSSGPAEAGLLEPALIASNRSQSRSIPSGGLNIKL